MYSVRQHEEAEQISASTGMGFIQALRQVQMRDELRRRPPRRRFSDWNDDTIVATWKD